MSNGRRYRRSIQQGNTATATRSAGRFGCPHCGFPLELFADRQAWHDTVRAHGMQVAPMGAMARAVTLAWWACHRCGHGGAVHGTMPAQPS